MTYQACGFLDKNKDLLPDPVIGVLKFSRLKLVKTLFSRYPDYSGNTVIHNPRLRPRLAVIVLDTLDVPGVFEVKKKTGNLTTKHKLITKIILKWHITTVQSQIVPL